MTPVLPPFLTFLIIIISNVVQLELVGAASSSTSTFPGVNHNRLHSISGRTNGKTYPVDDDYLDSDKDPSTIKRSRGRSDFDSSELERTGIASGRPLSTSAKERNNLVDFTDKTGCPPEFQGRCKCGYVPLQPLSSGNNGKQYFTVNCTKAGFTSAESLLALPQITEALIFSGNSIGNLPLNIFGITKTYPDLVYIDLSNNEIENILGKTFHRVNATEILILSNNKISRLTLQDHKRVFSNFVSLKHLRLDSAFAPNPDLLNDLSEVFIESNLTKVEKLHLEHNGIDYIGEPKVFCELKSLQDLHLSQNQLSDLDLDLTCLNSVRYIDITWNNIKTVGESSGIWKLLHESNSAGGRIQVNLLYNPFECDCKLDAFLDLVRNWTKVNPDFLSRGEILTCKDGFPNNNTNLFLKDVEFTACPLLQGSDYVGTVMSTIGWILGILFLLGVGYFLYSNQRLICRPVSPLHQTTTQGVKYTTIQEEEAEVAHV
ncbi:unnamed protein product [Orchesella dallaii]|uniref:Uncharacterized protein n=1 Tax=Orchesella dallaii TaxID=48710 RepID=A0ABP1QGN3_9HEXA